MLSVYSLSITPRVGFCQPPHGLIATITLFTPLVILFCFDKAMGYVYTTRVDTKGDVMSIGYACLAVGVPQSEMKSLTLSKVSEKTLLDTCSINLAHLKNLLLYTQENDLKLFRISSDLIPFGSSDANTLPWWDVFAKELASLGNLATSSGIRLSMHPGQYTVLNSPRPEVVDNAIADLAYHAKVLTSMGLGNEHKIVLHIGGAYGDKVEASKRFVSTYRTLPQGVKDRLILENDDKLFTISEVLAIAREVGCPVVFDNLHHKINPSKEALTDTQWIEACASTWKEKDGKQKIHYAQQAPRKRQGSHSPSIALDDFLLFYEALPDKDIDIMLEVKDKNISALKCMHATMGATKEQLFEQWLKYKPLITEREPAKIWKVEDLLKDAEDGKSLGIAFYRLLEKYLSLEVTRSQAAITANTIAEKCIQSPAEEKRIAKRIAEYKQAQIPLGKLKQSIMNVANKHRVDEVLTSYYPMI